MVKNKISLPPYGIDTPQPIDKNICRKWLCWRPFTGPIPVPNLMHIPSMRKWVNYNENLLIYIFLETPMQVTAEPLTDFRA